jgi:hypothetical protein
VRITQPVLGQGGQADGLLVSPLDLQQLHQRLFARLPAQARVAVVDGSNRLVLQSQHQNERVGKPEVDAVAREIDRLRRQRAEGPAEIAAHQFVETGFDGTRRLFSMRPVPLTDWVVVASLPMDETLQAYRDTRNRTLAIKTDSLDDRLDTLNDTSEVLNIRLTALQKRYQAQFGALDQLLTNLTNQNTFLTAQLNALSKQTGN